jgi:hypothetical protein
MTKKTFVEYRKHLLVIDKSWPTFGLFQCMNLKQYFTVFPSHFNNVFLKSFRLLQEFSEKLCDFTIVNEISHN